METTDLDVNAALKSLSSAMEEDDKSKILKQLSVLDSLGRPQTYDSIASTYEFGGIDVAPRYDLAYEWYMKSALEQNNCESFFSIGRFYFHGHAVQKDLAQSNHYYQVAHSKGSYVAGIMLADRYMSGEGVPVDLEQAEMYLEHAQAEGYLAALLLRSKIEFRRKRFISAACLWVQCVWNIVRLVFNDPHSPKLYALKTGEMVNDDIAAARKSSIEWSGSRKGSDSRSAH